jgi:hypothetical protein
MMLGYNDLDDLMILTVPSFNKNSVKVGIMFCIVHSFTQMVIIW